MERERALLFNRSDVQELLSLDECIAAVERVFRRQGEGKIPPSGILETLCFQCSSALSTRYPLLGMRWRLQSPLNSK